jgi:hypothetical protein
MNLTAAIHARLSADSAIQSMIAEYQGEPAIFTSWRVPPDAARPYIVTAGNLSDVDDDAEGVEMRVITRDIGCYADDTGSAQLIELLAEAVRASLHGSSFIVGDKRVLVCRCSGPIIAPTDHLIVGRIVTASFLTT